MNLALRDQLGPSLRALVEERTTHLTSIRALSAGGPGSARCAFELRFADNSRCKGRRFDSPAAAEAAFTLLAHLNHPMLALPLAHRHDSTLEPWVEGVTLADSAPTKADVRDCAWLLATLHTSALPSALDRIPGFAPRSVQSLLATLHHNLQTLRDAGLIDARRAAVLLDRASSDTPLCSPVGIVHRDLCPENIVRTPDGRVVVIDSGLLTVGPLEEDLWRVWYRWPMSDGEWRSVRDAYRQAGGPARWEPGSAFWPIVVIINSARVRLGWGEAGARHAGGALARLELHLSTRSQAVPR